VRIRESSNRRADYSLIAVGILVCLAIWTYLTWGKTPEERLITPLILPSPVEVLFAFPTLFFKRNLMEAILYSFFRVTVSFLIAAFISVVLGLFMGCYPKVRAFFTFITVAGTYMPIAALIPITLSLFGIDEAQKVAFLSMGCFFILVPTVVQIIREIDDVYLNTAYTLGAKQRHIITRVLLPMAQHKIFYAFQTVYGVGWGLIILAELVNAKNGLGHLILTSQRRSLTEDMYAVLLIIIGFAFLIDRSFTYLGKRLFPYVERG